MTQLYACAYLFISIISCTPIVFALHDMQKIGININVKCIRQITLFPLIDTNIFNFASNRVSKLTMMNATLST